MDLLARREHSRVELAEKLGRRCDRPELIDTVLDQLTDEGLQSDHRYGESFLRNRAERYYGPRRIRDELRQRGVAIALVEVLLREAPIDWDARLRALWIQRTDGRDCADFRERARHLRFCQQRGFDVSRLDHVLAVGDIAAPF